MLSEISKETDFLGYFTVFSFINTDEILSGSGYTLLATAVLLPFGVLLFGAGIWVFNRRSLAL